MQDLPVLVILDDDDSIATVIAAVGRQAGFDAISTTDAKQFRDIVRQQRVEVVILDLQMPGHDGISMLRHLADASIGSKVIVISGMDERTIKSAEQYGLSRGLAMIGTLQKPFDPDDLLRYLESAHAGIRALTMNDLQQAIGSGDLLLYYQPTVRRFADGTWDIDAVEALLRWKHPVRGLLTPDKFLSMAEQHGLGQLLTDFVIQEGVQQLRGWNAVGINVGLRINIAAALISDLDFPDRLERMLLEQHLDPRFLTLEVTETGMLEQLPATFDILTRLRIKDINLAIDDFGIGYSSLTQLFRMPFNEMKIDKSLVVRTPDSREASIMVEALVSLAHKLDLKVCAEGVERAATLEFLGNIACDSAQGFHISAPLPAKGIPEIIDRWGQALVEQPRKRAT